MFKRKEAGFAGTPKSRGRCVFLCVGVL